MYLFSRRIRIGPGRAREAMAWALAQTENVNKITGLQVGLYMQVFSPEVGAIGWSTFVPDLATLEAAGDKLNADDAFMSATDQGAAMTVGGADDNLGQVIYGEPDPNRQIEYVTAVRTVCASGNVARGSEVGVELAQRAEKITGTPTLFLADVTGTYGGVGWVSGHANVQAMEAAQQALAADSSWLKYVDKEAGAAYADDPSLSTQLIYRRLA
ncbi:MAG: hypothetical protein WEA75_08135 [Acidimicrobiia bacterium]